MKIDFTLPIKTTFFKEFLHFFYYMFNKAKDFYNTRVVRFLHFYWTPTYENWLSTI